MVVIREVFIAKPGMASKMAKMFKDMVAQGEMGKGAKVLTDMTGAFNKVVIETEYDNLATYEREMEEYMSQPQPPPDPSRPRHTELYTHGEREIYRVW